MSFFFKVGEKKCLSSSSFFLGFCELRRQVQPQGQAGFERFDSEQFQALVEERVRSLVPTCVHSLVVPPSLKGAFWALRCCSYSY